MPPRHTHTTTPDGSSPLKALLYRKGKGGPGDRGWGPRGTERHWLIDVKGWTAWSFFFRVVGANAITIYLLRCYIDFNFASRRFLIGTLNMLPYHWVAPVTTAGAFILAWLMLLLFYKKKIFFKV